MQRVIHSPIAIGPSPNAEGFPTIIKLGGLSLMRPATVSERIVRLEEYEIIFYPEHKIEWLTCMLAHIIADMPHKLADTYNKAIEHLKMDPFSDRSLKTFIAIIDEGLPEELFMHSDWSEFWNLKEIKLGEMLRVLREHLFGRESNKGGLLFTTKAEGDPEVVSEPYHTNSWLATSIDSAARSIIPTLR